MTIKPKEAAFEVSSDPAERGHIVIEGLRQNNLKNISLRIPHGRITAVVGLSGSGKSSLAFDTLFAEGRWRFMESLSTYTRLFLERMDRPDVDSIRNIRPAIAVEQKNPVRTSRSTVGTATELYDYLRLLFARVGRLHCPECSTPVESMTPESAADRCLRLAGEGGAAVMTGFFSQTTGAAAADVAAELMKKGFVRVLLDGAVVNISDAPAGEGARFPDELPVIIDRIRLDEKGRGRLVESFETAFRLGGDRAWAKVEGRDLLTFSKKLVCAKCNATVETPTPLSLSFNHPVGACQECKGFGNILRYDLSKVIQNPRLSLKNGAVEPWTKPAYGWWQGELRRLARRHSIDMERPFEGLSQAARDFVIKGEPGVFDGIDGFFEYLESKKYKLHVKVFISRYKGAVRCPSCGGTRLKKGALSVRVGGLNIAELNALTIEKAGEFIKALAPLLTPFEKEASAEILRQTAIKLDFMNSTGLGYLTLDRLTKTLSGGEAQRVSIATQLASSLTGVLYILDEPSIGLHPVDTDMLMDQLRRLSGRGNTVVMVEHDPAMIRAAENIVELGPGSGERGGRLVWSGEMAAFLKDSKTVTAAFLNGAESILTPRWRRKGSGFFLTLKNAAGNNLKGVDLKVPLKTLTCVTGVSGSGKSTLVVDTLYNALARRYGVKAERPEPHGAIEGADRVRGVRMVDQGPVGRSPRSNPVTYIGAFDEIRRAFAALNLSRAMGLDAGSFSFNTEGGRCEACKGEGAEKLEMYFLPDVYIKCAACGGRRYKPSVLKARFKGKNIHDVLEMTFDEAAVLFVPEPALQRKFAAVRDVGLGYLKLGQSALTLSGGEAQRLKIAWELVEEAAGDILYIFDEPTTGLHMEDTRRLLSVLGRLVDSGNTVLLIEHNLDCVKAADHVIDLGPGGGDAGGRVVASGTPETIARSKESVTGRYLKGVL